MKKLFSFYVALLVLAFGASAQAATYDSLAVSHTVLMGNVPLSGASWTSTGTVGVYTDDQANQHVLPLSSAQAGQYLSVQANSTATYTLTAPKTMFAFNWGTVDSYNTLKITRADNSFYTVTGTDIINLATSQFGTFHGGSDNIYVTLTDNAGIKSVTFIDGASNAFEVSDLRTVPLPGALGLFGAALFGVGGIRRRFAV